MPPRHPTRRQRPGETTPSQDQLEELLATVAHELCRPLTALLGALATIQQRGPALSATQQQELLTMARRQGTHLQRLLEQLLVADAADIQAVLARVALVDAATLATEAGRAAQLAHPHHRITIDTAGPLIVQADPLAITSILGNLLDNAAAHSPIGSLIRLRGGRDGTEAVLIVQDQGPGIRAEAQARIFEPYVQLDRPGGPTGQGSAWGCTLPGGWPALTGASFGLVTRPAAAAAASSFTSRSRAQQRIRIQEKHLPEPAASSSSAPPASWPHAAPADPNSHGPALAGGFRLAEGAQQGRSESS
jgi:two-component system OmpR family sensor kinase